MKIKHEPVVIKWSWEDVQAICPNMTPEEAENALHTIEKALQDRSIEFGWDIMKIELSCNDL